MTVQIGSIVRPPWQAGFWKVTRTEPSHYGVNLVAYGVRVATSHGKLVNGKTECMVGNFNDLQDVTGELTTVVQTWQTLLDFVVAGKL